MTSLFSHGLASAEISPCGVYRYNLVRAWDDAAPRVCFVMLNPSTANARCEDPTLRRCRGFAQSWGFGSLELVNLFAYRSADPRSLVLAQKLTVPVDPIGPQNDVYIDAAVARAARVIVAWGGWGSLCGRDAAVLERIPEPHCLGATRNGHPLHPLYVPKAVMPVPYPV